MVYSVSPEIAALFLEKLPDRCEEILRASFSHPDLCIRVNSLKTSPEILRKYFQEKGVSVREGRVPGCFYVDFHGDLAADEAFQRGMFHVLGEASQIACAALSPRPGEKVLDLGAAPGGKSLTLAQYMENRGQLCARDAAENRLSLIEEAFRRCGVTCGQVRCADAAVFDEKLCDADAVLCDVPCSGLGILSKKPDIRCKDLKGLPELLRIQREILCTAAKYVKPGGRLVYSTCTLNPDENEETVQAFLRENSEFYLRKTEFSRELNRILIYSNAKKLDVVEYAAVFNDGYLLDYVDVQSVGGNKVQREVYKAYEAAEQETEKYIYSELVMGSENVIFHIRRMRSDFERDVPLIIMVATNERDIASQYENLVQNEGEVVYLIDEENKVLSSNKEDEIGSYIDEKITE